MHFHIIPGSEVQFSHPPNNFCHKEFSTHKLFFQKKKKLFSLHHHHEYHKLVLQKKT